MQTVMLTGATGFIGSHIAERLLRENACVHLWVRRRNYLVASLERAGAMVYSGHPNDRATLKESLQGADSVIHCAGAVRALNEEQYFEANIGLTQRILELLKAPQVMILISSQAAAGPSGPCMSLSEDAVPHPVSHYGRSKLAAEERVKQWGAANGGNFTILRPAVVYGPGEKDLYNYFKWIKRGLLPLFDRGRQQISIIHVEDLVSAISASSRHSPSGEVYFVSNDHACSLKDIGYAIREAFHKTRLVDLNLPLLVLDSLAFLLDAASLVTRKPAILSREKVLEIKQSAWLCSNGKVKEKLGWKPRIPLKEGIRLTAEWYVEHGWL